jgi:integrase
LLCLAYSFAFRKGELLAMRVSQIDLANRSIRLEVGTTKNGKGRTISMTQEAFTLLRGCIVGKKHNDYVFTRENDQPVRDFRKTWNSVCVRAGVGHYACTACDEVVTGEKCMCGNNDVKYQGLLFHDLRRTGVRNLRRLGVAESVAMKISGHKTAAAFKRYDITDEADIADVAVRLDKKSGALDFGQSSGRNFENRTKNDAAADPGLTLTLLPNRTL